MKYFCFMFLFVTGLHAKIYDCFIFFNELELLEVRLNELYDHVDKFVLVEYTETFRGKPKPLYYEENKERFRKFSDKIIHIILTDHFDTPNPWVRESYQRQQILRGLKGCQPDDIITICDADEIISAACLPEMTRLLLTEKNGVVGCPQVMYRFFLNAQHPIVLMGPVAATYGYLMKNHVDLSEIRFNNKGRWYPLVQNAGWHFSSMGGHKRVVQKLESFSHQEDDTEKNKTSAYIDGELERCAFFNVDESFPKYILDHLPYFKELGWIYPVAPEDPAGYLKNRISPIEERYHTFHKALVLLQERKAKVCVVTDTAKCKEAKEIFGHFAKENQAVLHTGGPLPEKIDFLYFHSVEEFKAALPYLTDKSVVLMDEQNEATAALIGRGWKVIKQMTELLLIKEEKEPSKFEMAQNYKSLKYFAEAIPCYKASLEIKGEPEEAWFARYQLGECYEIKDEWNQAIYWYIEAYQYNPQRREPLVKIARHYRFHGKQDLAHLFAKQGSRITSQDLTRCKFRPGEDYQSNEELSICSFYTRYREDGLTAINELIHQKGVPKPIKDQAYYNLMFYTQPLQNTRVVALSPKIEAGYHPKNLSIQKMQNGYHVVCSAVNYTQAGAIIHKSDSDPVLRSKNFLLEYDRNFQLISQKEIVRKEGKTATYCGLPFEGLEDCHLIGDNAFTCSVLDAHPCGLSKIALCEFDHTGIVKTLTLVKGQDPGRAEKNWLPYIKEGELQFIRSFDEYPFQCACGPIPFDDGYLMVAREFLESNSAAIFYQDGNEKRTYYHRFLYLDKDFKIQCTSLPFIFKHHGVEVCSGMTLDHSGKEIVLTVASGDKEAYLCFVDLNTIRSLLKPEKVQVKPKHIDILSYFSITDFPLNFEPLEKEGYSLRSFYNNYEDYLKTAYSRDTKKIAVVGNFVPREVVSQLPKEKLVLYVFESCFEPKDPSYYSLFSKVYTVNEALIDHKKFFPLYYPCLLPMRENRPAFNEKKFCTMVASHWTPERSNILYFFEGKPEGEFDYYGFRPGPTLKNYRGAIPGIWGSQEKHNILSQYRFSFCFENNQNVRNYITEKIFCCFAAGCIPIYWGAPNVLDYIPKDCFIDYRDFKSNEELYQFLKNMPEATYRRYLDQIQKYLQSEKAKLFSPACFVENLQKEPHAL